MKNITKRLLGIVLACAIVISGLVLDPVKVSADGLLLNTPSAFQFDKMYQTGVIKNSDYYEYNMTLAKSGKVAFVGTNQGSDTTYIKIYNEDGEIEITSLDFPDGGSSSRKVDLLAGRYTIRVVATRWSWDTSNLSFSAKFTNCNETVSESTSRTNNVIGFDTPYTLGSTVTGQLALNDNADIYSFTVKKAGFIKIQLRSTQVESYQLSLIDSNEKVSYKESVSVGDNQYRYFVPKGKYYLTIAQPSYNGSKNTGTYSVKASLSAMPKLTLKKVYAIKNYWGDNFGIKTKWGKKGDATGYQVQFARNKKFTKGKKMFTIDSNYNNTYECYGLKRNKKYYVRMRYYITVNGSKYFSSWSNVKTKKTKR